jgi:hypothetical protein
MPVASHSASQACGVKGSTGFGKHLHRLIQGKQDRGRKKSAGDWPALVTPLLRHCITS